MEPAVPFALLGAVQLVATAAWVALAGAAVALRSGVRTAAGVLCLGAAVLAGVETATALRFGDDSSDNLLLVRAAGLLLLAAGLYTGALSRRRTPAAVPATSAASVVVPLGAAPGPAVLAAAAALLAGLGALRGRRDPPGVTLAGGLLLAGVAAALAPLAGAGAGPRGALAVLVVRAVSAALVLAALVLLARSSLLAKVVAAILAAVLAVAVAAVGVVGTAVERGFAAEQAALVRDAAQGRSQLLQQALDRTAALAPVLSVACTNEPTQCDELLMRLTEPGSQNFALLVPRAGEPTVLGGRAPLSPSEALALAGSDLVADVLVGGAGAVRVPVPARVRLLGAEPGLALVVAQALGRPTPAAPAESAFVYGVRIGQSFVDEDFDAGGFGLTLLLGDDVVASNLSERERGQIARIAGSVATLGPEGVTVPAGGTSPTVQLLPLTGSDGDTVATLALSRDAEQALAAQRAALSALLLTVLVTTGVVAGLALLLGRRTVDPVRRLTAAAERVSAGDLGISTGVAGADEVGTLARTFDTMTGSLARLTDDLRASAARLETVLASMSDGLVVTDGKGRVTSMNRAALAMAGLDDVAPDDLLGHPLLELLDLRHPTGEPLADVAGLRDAPAEVHRADGTSTPVRAAAAPLDTGDGVVLVLRDTTREREVERMKTEFLSNVSHELRTPLTPIRGYADILAGRPGLEPDQVTRFAGTILAESLKMNRVVDLLVDVATIEAGRVTTHPRAVPVRELLDARVDAWRTRVPERAGDLRRRAATGLPPVVVDPEWLGKALDELVDNALKHTPSGTSVTLTAAAAPGADRVRLAVRDTGPGIDAADRELLFTSFEQVDGSATRRVGGLGLGLSFVRRVAEDAGWVLTVTTAPGKGAQFALDVPAADVPAPRRRRRRRPAVRAR